jgi:hypothetical protein|nr:MAG TPA: hypothetical protein [Caudoviricetes sp.]
MASIKGKIKNAVLGLAMWSKKHLSELITLIGILICCFVLFVLISWGVGYYANGLFGLKFDLGSIWQGLGACVAAIGSLLTMAGVNLGRQYIDSKFNSPLGERPGEKKEEKT